jgi:hypothetical protein
LELSKIKQKIKENKIQWRVHATRKLIERAIKRSSVIEAILNGDIIEEYPLDYPFPSCLVFGYDQKKTPLHVVCSLGADFLWIITVYKPDLEKWEKDLKTRRKQR